MSDTLNTFQVCLDEYGGGGTGSGPRGYQGYDGPQGFQGVQGVQGWQGLGAVGAQGAQGNDGSGGTPGLQGYQGLQGVQGSTGSIGVQGRQGIQGVQGPTNAEFVITTAYQALGSAIKSVNLNHLTGWTTTSISLTSQQALFLPVYVQTTQTITGVMFEIDVQGSFTASNFNGFGLYSISAGTLTRERATANDGNVFKNVAQTFLKVQFTSTYTAAPGVYYICILYSQSAQTTAPALSGTIANFNIGRVDFSNSYVLAGYLSAQTSLPLSTAASGLTLSNNSVWINLY